LALSGALILSGCDAFHTETRPVGPLTFKVPTRYLVNSAVPWLPRSQATGLLFALNPKDPAAQQHIVLVQALEKICPPAPVGGASQAVCRMAASVKDQAPVLAGPFEKVHAYGDLSQWEYQAGSAGGLRPIVASCYALGDASGDGLCTAFTAYKSLIYVTGFRDSEIAQLPAFEKQATGLLSRWDRSR
jgi:hypothetical protein